eukprot:g6782.t1
MSPAYDFNHYDEWRRVGAPPRRCDEGCTSVESLRRSMRCKRKKMPRSLEPLDDAPFLRQASDELPHRPKDQGAWDFTAQSKSAVVLPPLEQKRRPSEPVNHGVARVSSGSISIDSQDSSPSTQESPAPVSPNAHSGNFTSEPAVEGLVLPSQLFTWLARGSSGSTGSMQDIWMRWHFDGTGFSASELLRVRQAFDLFKYSDVSEISSEVGPVLGGEQQKVKEPFSVEVVKKESERSFAAGPKAITDHLRAKDPVLVALKVDLHFDETSLEGATLHFSDSSHS